MKSTSTCFFAAICLASTVQTVRTQNYTVDWHKIAGGGGASANGQYTLTGTIGQHDASVTAGGGNFSVMGGFWSAFALQSPGAPTLTIALSGTNAVVAWPATATGFSLQTTSDPGSGVWSSVTNSVNVMNGQDQVTFTPTAGNQFFRLIK